INDDQVAADALRPHRPPPRQHRRPRQEQGAQPRPDPRPPLPPLLVVALIHHEPRSNRRKHTGASRPRPPPVLCPHPRSSPMPATRKPVTRKTTAKRPAARSAKTATRKSVAPAKTSKPAAPA